MYPTKLEHSLQYLEIMERCSGGGTNLYFKPSETPPELLVCSIKVR